MLRTLLKAGNGAPAGILRCSTLFGCAAAVLLLSICGLTRPVQAASDGAAGAYDVPFAADADYDPSLPALDELLGFSPGSRPSTPEQIEQVYSSLAASSPRVQLLQSGRTHEGRNLFYAIVGSPENLERLDSVEAALSRLADGGPPASESSGATAAGGNNETASVLPKNEIPVVIWVGGSIHGNEPSGADAAMILLYHLAADRSEATRGVLRNALVLIDPLQNPDGRARMIGELSQWSSRIPNLDSQSMQHREGWPSARGNHYFLDINRDWFALTQPETRARVEMLLRWHPQVTIDLHEMGGSDTYLFSPPRPPFNPHVPEQTAAWWHRFSQAQARAFGRYGWSCYRGDWNEEFNPNRGAAWALHLGAVAILEEQARTDGASLRRPDQSVLQYREAVHHHFVATLAVIESAAEARGELLQSFSSARQEGVREAAGGAGAYIIRESPNPELARHLAATLRGQGCAVRRALGGFRLPAAVNYWGERRGDTPFEAGSYIVDLHSGEARLARAILDFDPPMGSEFLSEERRRLEMNQPSLFYETSAWCLAMACGADVYRADARAAVRSEPFSSSAATAGALVRPSATYGFVLDALDGGSTSALAELLSGEFTLWAALDAFSVEGCAFSVGSILLRCRDNPPDLAETLERLARKAGARFHGLDHPLTEGGPDLGSRHFRLLQPPQVAILAGPPFYYTTFGATWYLLDAELGLRCSILRPGGIGEGTDLDRYNVILVPDAAPGKGPSIVATLGPAGLQALRNWVNRGGTLITLGEGNWILFGGTEPFGTLRAHRQVLGEIELYLQEARREMALRSAMVDEEKLRRGEVLFAGIPPFAPSAGAPAPPSALPLVSPAALQRDEWLRRFSPAGAILRVDLDPRHWLAAGLDDRIPAMVKTDLALRARQPAESVGRFAEPGSIRLSGLLWPEARERWGLSNYLTRERVGDGQVISFQGNPFFRATFQGTGRLLINAILLGPGLGARTRAEW